MLRCPLSKQRMVADSVLLMILKPCEPGIPALLDRRIIEDSHCPRALRAKRLLTSALVASMHQPVGLSIEVAYEISYVKLKNTHCQQTLRAKRPLTGALVA